MEYRATLERDTNGTILVSFPDLPGAHSFGKNKADALAHGQDALVTILEALIRDRRPIPAPTAGEGPLVSVPALLTAKIALHNEMLAQQVNKSELGRRLKQHLPQIDRLVNVRHGSKLDQLEAAFKALGKRIEIRISDEPRSVAHERKPSQPRVARHR